MCPGGTSSFLMNSRYSISPPLRLDELDDGGQAAAGRDAAAGQVAGYIETLYKPRRVSSLRFGVDSLASGRNRPGPHTHAASLPRDRSPHYGTRATFSDSHLYGRSH